jgi:hypothetical protein
MLSYMKSDTDASNKTLNKSNKMGRSSNRDHDRGQQPGRGGGYRRGFSRGQSKSRSCYDNKKGSKKGSQYKVKFSLPSNDPQQIMHSFTTCVDAIVEDVQRTFRYPQDMAEAIRELKHFDMKKVKPKYVASTETDTAKKKIDEEGLKIMFDANYKAWRDRKEIYVSNKSKAYSLILTKYCSSGMKTKVEEHPDFETKIRDDPIELLIAV